MDFSVVGSSSSVISMLVELLAAEKDATRGWLRAEMDRLVDPMLDSIFNRLTNKLVNATIEPNQSGDGADCGQLMDYDAQMHLPPVAIAQPSTSSHLITQHANVHYSYQQPNDPIQPNDNFNQQSELTPHNVQPTMSQNIQVNLDVLSNESTGHTQLATSLSTTIGYEQSNHNSNEQNGEVEDEDECFCDECLGVIEIKLDEVEDDSDDDDSVQLIEDDLDDEESVPSVKRPRMDSTQPNNVGVARQSPRQPIDEAQPNQVNKQIITVHLQCIDSQCPATFPEDQLNQHMFDAHSIGPSRCLLKDCKQSFDNIAILYKHIKQAHQGIVQWHCAKCCKHFPKYKSLVFHNSQYHQLGLFQCSFSACTFTGQCKAQVYRHYKQQHKPELACSHPDCNYRTHRTADLRIHERVHLGIKPYRCKWSNCDYSSSYQQHTLSHIRTHLARAECSNQDGAHSVDQKDYLEVVSELL